MICPDCGGNKKIYGYAKPIKGSCKPRMVNCFRCKGNGEVPNEMNEWIKEGQKVKDFRLLKNMTLREYAKKAAMTVYDLSQAENGYVDPRLIKIND